MPEYLPHLGNVIREQRTAAAYHREIAAYIDRNIEDLLDPHHPHGILNPDVLFHNAEQWARTETGRDRRA